LTNPLDWQVRVIVQSHADETSADHVVAQLQRINTQPETVQSEFDAIKDHLETYITPNATAPASALRPKPKQPSRHISHLTQMAAKALGRDIPGMMGRPKRTTSLEKGKEKAGWDELEPYNTKNPVKELSVLGLDDEGARARLEMVWGKSWMGDGYGQAK
jgi:dynactin-4